MIAPNRHVTSLEDLTQEERTEIMELLIKTVRVLKAAFTPDGFNIGFNIGKAAGAGEEHIHMHIVPRWIGDTNFMPVIGNTKVIPQSLAETCKKLAEAYNNL